jgi:hypothetical protein
MTTEKEKQRISKSDDHSLDECSRAFSVENVDVPVDPMLTRSSRHTFVMLIGMATVSDVSSHSA